MDDMRKEILNLSQRIKKLEALLLGEPLDIIEPPPIEEEKKKRKIKLSLEAVKKLINKGKYISHTELDYIAQTLGIGKGGKMMDIETLKSAFLGEEVSFYGDPWEEQRNKIAQYIQAMPVAPSLVRCNLKCKDCPTHRVSMCWTENSVEVERHHREKEMF